MGNELYRSVGLLSLRCCVDDVSDNHKRHSRDQDERKARSLEERQNGAVASQQLSTGHKNDQPEISYLKG